MPNHITNVVEFTGSGVTKLLSTMRTSEDAFDFNGAVPMPEELRGTRSPAHIISEEEYKKQGPQKEGYGRSITQEMSDELIRKYGSNNWYDWSIRNWGTKWGAYDVYFLEDNVVEFNTAWCTPFAFLEKLSQMFPNVTISVRYADEDFGSNVGRYTLKAGDIIDEFIPENGSYEAYEMAREFLGYDLDYFRDSLHYVEDEDELDNDWYNYCLNKVFEGGVIDETLPIFILKRLETMAVDNEKYEFAADVMEVIVNKIEE